MSSSFSADLGVYILLSSEKLKVFSYYTLFKILSLDVFFLLCVDISVEVGFTNTTYPCGKTCFQNAHSGTIYTVKLCLTDSTGFRADFSGNKHTRTQKIGSQRGRKRGIAAQSKECILELKWDRSCQIKAFLQFPGQVIKWGQRTGADWLNDAEVGSADFKENETWRQRQDRYGLTCPVNPGMPESLLKRIFPTSWFNKR